MLKSISNIAWMQDEEEWVLEQLRQLGWNAIEVAPSKIWEDFRSIPRNQRSDYRKYVEEYGLKICSLHSLFWGIENAKLFGTVKEQENLKKYFRELVDLAVDLGSKVMIFGSPSVRDRGTYEYRKALDIAGKVLHESAEYAKENGVKILIEALTVTETNFINTHSEALALIAAVDSDGLGLHLDAKSLASEKTEIKEIIRNCKGKIEHFHINDPDLGEVGLAAGYHKNIGEALKEINYTNYVSIEMRRGEDAKRRISNSIKYVNEIY